MNAELTEVARRFVACPGWVFLPGMALVYGFRHDIHSRCDGTQGWPLSCSGKEGEDMPIPDGALPDLDDPVTAAGILPVVRRAWDDSLMFVAYDADSMDYAELQPFGVWLPRIPGPLPIAVGPSELLALLAALEAAPK